jgi:signal transduction histidine kinase
VNIPLQSNYREKTIRRPSIRFYLVLMNLVLLCLLFPIASLLFLHQEAKFRDAQLHRAIEQMHQSLENRSGVLVRNMALSAGYAIAGYDFTFLNNMVRQVVTEDTEIKYCLIMDTNLKAVAHSNPEMVGSTLTGARDKQAAALMGSTFPSTISDENSSQVHFLDESIDQEDSGRESTMEVLTPIYNGAKLYGVLRCGFSLKKLSSQIRTAKTDWAVRTRQFKLSLASIAGILFAIGVVIAALFTRLFVRSMQVVSTGVSRVAQGNLDHEIQSNRLVCSELVDFSESFNVMTKQLKISHEKLDEYSKSLEYKVAERTKELKDTQANLLQQAHEAGMAEMAVGILHNIGNAITPAKVGLFRLFNRMGEKPLLRNLPVALDEIAEILPTLSTLSDKERGRLHDIIRLIPATIEEEYVSNADEIDRVRIKLAHIESIIALQMQYTQLFGVIETVDVPQVVDDALTLLDDPLKKRSVRVIRQFSDVPPIRIERTKLIQVIVNLIKNGYEAMENTAINERALILSIHREQGTQDIIMLSVKDNGIGFDPGEHHKLFTFGYTTKTKGSGFGLHSCANYLIARNGSLTARSDGRGKGAEFMVRLAVNESKASTEGEQTS